MDVVIALDAATEEFGRRLALVQDDMWTLATPCPEWDVQYLTAHVVGGNRFATLVLGGTGASEAVAQVMSASQLGDDAMGAWTTTSGAQCAAFRMATALEQRVDHPLGELSGREFLELRIFDLTVHAWDLARSIGADERLDPDLVDVVIAIIEHGPPGMGFGIAAPGTIPVDTSAQSKLLDLAGRRP